MAYLVGQPRGPTALVPTPTPSTTVSWPWASFSKELVDLERQRGIFSCMNHTNGVWDFSQMGAQPLIDGIKLGFFFFKGF